MMQWRQAFCKGSNVASSVSIKELANYALVVARLRDIPLALRGAF